MSLLSVVEVASLTGLAPDEVRALICQGLLAARRVRLYSEDGFLVESEQLDQLRLATPNAAAPVRLGAPRSNTDKLLDALLGLRAALARRRSSQGAATEVDDDSDRPIPVSRRPTHRPAGGLSADELRAVATRIDRLSQPGVATRSLVSTG